jgi:hypothetical protein
MAVRSKCRAILPPEDPTAFSKVAASGDQRYVCGFFSPSDAPADRATEAVVATLATTDQIIPMGKAVKGISFLQKLDRHR